MTNSNDLTGRDSLGRLARVNPENRYPQNRRERRAQETMLRRKQGVKPTPSDKRHKCGECTACCHIVPVKEIDVRAWQGCPHECATGCSIYAARPTSCKIWNCQWLAEPGWDDKYRPDRCGVVVDVLPDTMGVRNEETGEIVELPCWQFWVERGHEDDWQDPDSLVQDLIGSVTANGAGVLWRTFDPVHGQACRAFWIGDGKIGPVGVRCTVDGGPPTRRRSDAERIALARDLFARL